MGTTANYGNITGSGQRGALSAANTNRNGTGTLVTIATGGASGSRIDDITIKALVTTTAGMVRLYTSFDNGTTNDLIAEVIVTAITASATVPSFEQKLVDQGIILPTSTSLLRASTERAEAFRLVVTRKGDF